RYQTQSTYWINTVANTYVIAPVRDGSLPKDAEKLSNDFTYKKSAMAKPWRFFVLRRILSLQQNAQHAAQRFGRTPEQLITDGERTQIMRAHVELAQPPYRYAQSTGHSSRTQLLHARISIDRKSTRLNSSHV